jgi:hypothetical protein
MRWPAFGCLPKNPLVVLLVSTGLAGCEKNTCPSFEMEVRAFEGEPVEETTMTCTGGLVATCPEGPQTFGGAVGAECGDTRVIRMGANFLGGLFYSIYANESGTEARAQMEGGCDDDGCTTETKAPIAGWVMFEELEERVAGRYEMEFDNGVISGDFDTLQPAADASVP